MMQKTTFIMSQTDDILAANLRNNIDAPYSCQGGVCSSCLAKVTEGKAVMVKNSILTDGELEEGLILTCQAHPTTPKITIDFDGSYLGRDDLSFDVRDRLVSLHPPARNQRWQEQHRGVRSRRQQGHAHAAVELVFRGEFEKCPLRG